VFADRARETERALVKPADTAGGVEMRGSKQDLPIAFEVLGVVSRDVEWGDMNVAIESFPAGLDPAPYFEGLPDDRCQCPHWGYVLKGQMRYVYADREEVLNAGDIYYAAPGHLPIFDQDTEVVELSPRTEYHKTMDVVGQNLERLLQTA
jgi:hypothetical protein